MLYLWSAGIVGFFILALPLGLVAHDANCHGRPCEYRMNGQFVMALCVATSVPMCRDDE